jgi:hypothetical protein
MYFKVEAQAGSRVLTEPGPYRGVEGARELVFDWFARSALGNVDVRPSFLAQTLAADRIAFTHVVQRDQHHNL